MKIKIDRQALASALAEAAPFIPSKPAVAVLKYAKASVNAGVLTIEAFNSQDSMVTSAPVGESDQDGEFLIDLLELSKFVSALKDAEVEIAADGSEVRVTHSKGSASWPSEDPAMFPALRKSEGGSEVMVDSKALAECVANAAPFASADDLRPILRGIYVTVGGSRLRYAATDTRRLIAGEAELGSERGEAEFIIQPSAFKPLLKMCKAAAEVKVSVSANAVSYSAGGSELQAAIIAGKYPDYKRVVPAGWEMECLVDRDELSDSAKRVSMLGGSDRLLKVSVSPAGMAVSAANPESMKSASESVRHGGCAGELELGLHSDLLAGALSALGPGEVAMRMTAPSRPIVFAQESKPGVTVVLMPMSVR